MHRTLLLMALVAALMVPFGCSKKDDDGGGGGGGGGFGPSAVAVGSTTAGGLIMTTSDFLTWTEVTGHGITSTIDKVVMVPGHASGRMVIVIDGGVAHDTISYSDDGGATWTAADFGTAAELNLDPEHRTGATGTYDDWDIQEMIFLNATTGYAIGDEDYLIIWTYDAGATWHDLNEYQAAAPTTIAFQELQLNWTTLPASFVPGATVAGDDATAPGAGTIISVNIWDEEIVVEVTAPFVAGDNNVTVGTDIVPITSFTNNIWKYNFAGADSSSAGALVGMEATTGEHTIWMAQDDWYTSSGTTGIWTITTNAPATPDVRTFTVAGPPHSQQYSATVGEDLGENAIYTLFFFDATTGAAATDDGIWITTDGSAWTEVGTSSSSFYGLAYSSDNLMSSGFLYSINQSLSNNEPVRIAVTYTSPTWSFGATPALEVHGTAANVDMWYVDSPMGMFFHDSKIFCFESGDSTGYWGWSQDLNNATFDNTYWTDTSNQYLGGTATNATNEAYQKGVLQPTTAPTGTIYWITKK